MRQVLARASHAAAGKRRREDYGRAGESLVSVVSMACVAASGEVVVTVVSMARVAASG